MSLHIRRCAALLFATITATTLAGAAAPATAEPDGVGVEIQDEQLPEPSAACSTADTAGKRIPMTTADGRPYLVYVPKGLTGPAPLIVAVHGGMSSPDKFAGETGFDGYAESKKFIVAYPRGPKQETGGYGGWDWAKGSADVTFLRNVITGVANTYCVNPKRVHMVGHSNGGQITSRMACDSAGTIASAATFASYFPGGYDCTPSRKISFAVMLSANDVLTWQAGAESNRDMWRMHDACGAKTTETGYQVKNGESYACADGSEVVYRLYQDQPSPDQAHNWPTPTGNPSWNADIFNRMWKLFVDNQL
ncbi:alpha/beta hydrolase family esterase [Nocardia inohanensis]|uniref:alpha/beta hydrolase family esterase n=1 Tax=Nocardia inohanensis TaxID=209246 RepID=UPI0008335645|nr:PHB depolymerase family esterase [Nocardia inohanensis]